MVNTRSSRASEPLESLETPTKKQRKPNIPRKKPPSEELTKKLAPTPSMKRSHDQTSESTESPAKRTRCDGGDYIFQYARGEDTADESEDDPNKSAPPKTLAESIRRERRERAERKTRENLYGKSERSFTPRPGSIRARSKFIQDQTEHEKQTDSQTSPYENGQRYERSAAPEPETPRSGFLGSLRNFGTATIGRAISTITGFTPIANKGKSTIHDDQSTSPHPQPQTEPPRRAQRKPAWEIEYPTVKPLQEVPNTPTYRRFGVVPESAKIDSQNDSEAERKRKAFIRKWGEPDPRYDHLHLIPLEGTLEDLPYPPKKQRSLPESSSNASEQEQAFHRARKARREAILGKTPVEELPTKAPLFGPNSHWLRKTRAPEIQQFSASTQPSVSDEVGGIGSKRKFAPEEMRTHMTDTQKQQSMQATVEDGPESPEHTQEGPTTPAAKRQKYGELVPQTPRSALKAPGSLGRSGRNVAFNNNPVSSVRKFSPIYGDRRAGDRPFIPGSPFNTVTDEMQYAEAKQKGTADGDKSDSPASVASTDSYGISPNTFANTRANRGTHPGDALTRALNSTLPKVQYTWNDPYDPDWRPSLANPEPGTFRYVFEGEEDDELDQLADLEESETGRRPERLEHESEQDSPSATPPQPSTPRMSHAELPKQPGSGLAVPGAGPLEAVNLERRRAEATKNKPRMGSRLSEVTSARSRSPSPPPLDATTGSDDNESEKTPSPILQSANASHPTWIWTDETNEYICSDPDYPDFAYNQYDELIPSFCLRTSSGTYDDRIVGPDDMTEAARQKAHMAKWAAKDRFDFGTPQTYEESGCGTKHIHDLLRMNEKKNASMFEESYGRLEKEWQAHQVAIEGAAKENRELVATYPDREWMEEQMDEEL